MEKLSKQLTLKYAMLQGTYWISECVIYGFAVVYLQYKNFDNTQIGIIIALSAIMSIILQPVIAGYVDKSKKVNLRFLVIILMFIVFVSAFILFFIHNSFYLIAGIYVLINTIQFTLNSLFNSLAFEYMNKGIPINYGLARGGGSIAYAVTSSVLGVSVSRFGPGILLTVFLFSYILLIAAAYAFKISNKKSLSSAIDLAKNPYEEENQTVNAPTSILGFFMKYKKYTLLLIGIAMIFYSHSLLNTFLFNIIQNAGGDSADMGLALTISAALELPTMAGFIFLVRRIKCGTLLKISAFFFVIKVIIAWLAPNVAVIYISQALQMLSFALYTPASVYYVNSIIDKEDRVKGQSMLGVASWGIAGSIASITGGKILDTLGVSDMLLFGTLIAAIGFVIVFFTTDNRNIKA